MHLAELGDLQRQIAIALEPVLVDLHVARAVHRLAAEHALVGQRGREHVLAVVLPVAGELPEVLLHHVGRIDFHVAGASAARGACRQMSVWNSVQPFGVPEHAARRLLLEMEEIHLAPELPVVALLGFLDLLQVRGQLLLRRPRRAVDALELRVVLVAAPVGAGELRAA